MSESKRLLYRLAELMLDAGSNELSVDSLFDDLEIGDYVRSIQIDSPYQQMLLQGVLTETVKENELKLRFTFEGYFSFVLATIIQKKYSESFFEALLNRFDLDWIRKALEIFLLSDLKNGNFDLFDLLIRSQNKEILVFPLANYFEIYSTEIQNFDNDYLRKKRSFFDVFISHFSPEYYNLIFKSILLLETLNKSFVCEIIVRKLFEIKEEYSYDSIDFYTKIVRFIKSASDQLKEFNEIINWIDGKDFDRRFMLDIDSRLFNVYLNNSMLIECRELIRKCLKYEIEFFGKNHVFVANSYRDLGLIELKLTNGIVAKKFFKKSLEILIQNNESQKEKLILYFNLAVAEMHNRNFPQSIRIFKNILKIRVKEYGYYSINVSEVLGHLGIAFIENSEKNTANGISLILRAYKINKMIFKDINYPNINLRPYISRHFFDQGDLKRSEYILMKNLRYRQILFNKDSLNVSYSYSDLYHYYSEIGDWGKAV